MSKPKGVHTDRVIWMWSTCSCDVLFYSGNFYNWIMVLFYLQDVKHFHKTLKSACDKHNPTYYERFKAWCDNYFVVKHRGTAALQILVFCHVSLILELFSSAWPMLNHGLHLHSNNFSPPYLLFVLFSCQGMPLISRYTVWCVTPYGNTLRCSHSSQNSYIKRKCSACSLDVYVWLPQQSIVLSWPQMYCTSCHCCRWLLALLLGLHRRRAKS